MRIATRLAVGEPPKLKRCERKRRSLRRNAPSLTVAVVVAGAAEHQVVMFLESKILNNNLATAKSKFKYAKADLLYTDKHLRETQTKEKSLDRQVKKLENDAVQVEAEITELAQHILDARNAVKTAEEEHLGPFRQKTGLKDLGAYDDAVAERRKEFNEQRSKLMQHIAQLEQKKDYETNRDLEKPLAALEKRIQSDKAKLKKTQEKKPNLRRRLKKQRGNWPRPRRR